MSKKGELRRRLLAERSALDEGEAQKQSIAICDRLQEDPMYRNAGVILCYMPHKGEVDIRSLIEASWRAGKKVVLPRAIPGSRSLELYALTSFGDLTRGAYGIMEPKPEDRYRVLPEELELAIVPGLGFDRRGYRLGYGGGYYDRFFSGAGSHVARVGAAYAFQLVATVYPEAHDQPLHAVATPDGIRISEE
ncbi:5-formyltetrahydrofolate cyclo-ligase [Melghirimyces thermohalophilus]|uniref:5-formyltetrahydrofolate cyclo-ligase n=1 Tax=Melghirimyces thermohalophilus TaxID=1236220 RepID=A0A1G6R6F8_9BACL|nr:5-formyltetrahydrofolate cyclo-ligase [Melghirimyces thermohalophilus]SDC99864.1 5-formyltetrahydrofolate cyclo-ligase [Melghirimyces thermohalophilus]